MDLRGVFCFLFSILFLIFGCAGLAFLFFFGSEVSSTNIRGREKSLGRKNLGTIRVFFFLLVIITGVQDMLHVVIIMYNELFSSVYLLLPASLYDKLVGSGIAQRISYKQL